MTTALAAAVACDADGNAIVVVGLPAEVVDDAVGPERVEVDQARRRVAHDDVVVGELGDRGVDLVL
jgi:hypothetical protein